MSEKANSEQTLTAPTPRVLMGDSLNRSRTPLLSRADRRPVSIWFWEIDRVLLSFLAFLIGVGLIAVAAASPVSADKLSTATHQLNPLHFFFRQAMFVAIAVPVMISISMLTQDRARRLALWLALLFFVLLLAVPLIGTTVNGAQRWIGSGMFRLQPSEFLKPTFIVATAWLMAIHDRDARLPAMPLSFALVAIVAALLMMQPDLGQTVVFLGTWLCMALVAGLSLRIFAIMAGSGFGLMILAYFFYGVANKRINAWLFAQGDDFQTEKAYATLTNGGFFGAGPGAGTAKFSLPEAHTDYIFSVIGEEFGLFACIVIAAVFMAIILRVLVRMRDEPDTFRRLAVVGLITQFGGQACINMAVNTQIFPSKGMTLPFISYGGSSMIALALGMGLLLAFTRQNPYARTTVVDGARFDRSRTRG